jgi:hypothetical protein
MLRYRVRPLTAEAHARMSGRGAEISPFSAGWSSTLGLLEREVRALRGDDVVLMIDCAEGDLRIDGQLRANARPASPKVALAFTSRSKGPLMFACGRFRTWQDNVRAIALGLEALRKVERYGIVASDEQYLGFKAIGAAPAWPAWAMTLAAYSGLSYDDAMADPKRAYKLATRLTHPDAGGTGDQFREVREAFDASGAA